MYIKHILKVKL